MLLPLSDAPNPRGVPVVTTLLIAVNVVVYALVTLPLSYAAPDMHDPALREYLWVLRDAIPFGASLRDVVASMSAYDVFVFSHGFKPGAPSVADLFASLFLHSGLMHLVGNMLFLWIYGDNVEYRLGRVGFLLWYLATGVAATLAFSLFARGSLVPMVGASGAISGVLGFYFMWFPRNTVRMFVFLFPFFMNVVTIPARIVLGIYLVLDNLLPFLFSGGGGGGVAYGAHLGGFVTGLGVAWVMNQRQLSAAPDSYPDEASAPTAESIAAPPQAPAAPPTVGAFISDAIATGDLAVAARTYFNLSGAETRGLLSPVDSLTMSTWLSEQGHPDAALVVLRRHLRDYPTDPNLANVHLAAGSLLTQLGQIAPAYQHFLEVLDLNPEPATADAARAALSRIAELQKFKMGR